METYIGVDEAITWFFELKETERRELIRKYGKPEKDYISGDQILNAYLSEHLETTQHSINKPFKNL